ncbi:MAG: DUF1036 domain-containing protein [Pseudomonadota bacterium]
MLRLIFACLCFATPAFADLSVCNELDRQASVAIGYSDSGVWTSEGWWTMRAGDCKTIFSGALKHRFYYWRVSTPDGPLPAEDYTFCTSPKVFEIAGDENCEARGFDTARFTEVDTGDATDYVIVIEEEVAEDDAPQAEQHARIFDALQGFWRDAIDDDIRMLIENDRIVDYFGGVPGPEARFVVAETCPGAGGEGPVMLVLYEGFASETLCWVLTGIDGLGFAFRAVGGTSTVVMLRVR